MIKSHNFGYLDGKKPLGGILARRKMIQDGRQDSIRNSGYDSDDWD